MARIEHYDDPDARHPNSLVPAASAAVSNERDEILMQRRAVNDRKRMLTELGMAHALSR